VEVIIILNKTIDIFRMKCTQITLVIFAVIVGLIYFKYKNLSTPLPPPKFDVNAYWGAGRKDSYKEDKTIKTYKIDYTAKDINDLIERIDQSVLPTPLEDVGFDYGVNSKRFTEFLNFWKNDYLPRWKSEREPFLNSFPQYTTQIQGYVELLTLKQFI